MTPSLRDVVLQTPVAAILVGTGGGDAPVLNPAWSSLVGSDHPDWMTAIHPDDLSLAERLVRSRCEGIELRLGQGDRWRWVVASSHPCQEGMGLWFQPVGSERAGVLESLVRERELHALKNRFISLVSHEFRTPLTVILSSAELLEHYGAKWPEERRIQHLRKIHTAVVVMTTLLDNVGLYGRAESGSIENSPEPLDAAAMFQDVLEDLRVASPTAIDLVLDDRGGSRRPVVDAKLLRHVYLNLMGNAVRYSPHATPVESACFWEGETWVLEVSDRGIGIPPADLERVWERFQRGTNVDGIPGTGLGLAIVRRCAEIMGAKVGLREREGSGTIARLEIPPPASSAASRGDLP
jgi:signal transduction histidine kinase